MTTRQDRDRRKLLREQQRQTKALRSMAREQRRANRQRQQDAAKEEKEA